MFTGEPNPNPQSGLCLDFTHTDFPLSIFEYNSVLLHRGSLFLDFFVSAFCHNATEMAKLIAEMWEHSNIATRKSDSGRRHKQSDEL